MYDANARQAFLHQHYDTARLHTRIEALPDQLFAAAETLADARATLRHRENDLKDAEAVIRAMATGANKELRDASFVQLCAEDEDVKACRREAFDAARAVATAEHEREKLEKELGVLHSRIRLASAEIAAIFNPGR